jgi:hypothetical protein
MAAPKKAPAGHQPVTKNTTHAAAAAPEPEAIPEPEPKVVDERPAAEMTPEVRRARLLGTVQSGAL